jgi:hypothetical protein
MSCDFTEQVSLLIDGELSANEVSRVERHVASCIECQQARADFLNLRREIVDYQFALDPQMQERALAKILSNRNSAATREPTSAATRQPTSNAPSWRERFAASFGVPRFAAMATACALLLVVGFIGLMIYRNAHREPAIANLPANDHQPRHVGVGPAPEPQPSTQQGGEQQNLASKQNEPENQNRREAVQNRKGVVQTASNKQRERRAPLQPLLPKEPAANFVAVNASTMASTAPKRVRVSSADTESLTARHVEQSSLLLRAFRNARVEENAELSHEKHRAQQLLYQNILLRREATTRGNVQVASLLDSLEPILIDIANLPERPAAEEVTTIKQRMERKNLVALLQVNSTQLARAF